MNFNWEQAWQIDARHKCWICDACWDFRVHLSTQGTGEDALRLSNNSATASKTGMTCAPGARRTRRATSSATETVAKTTLSGRWTRTGTSGRNLILLASTYFELIDWDGVDARGSIEATMQSLFMPLIGRGICHVLLHRGSIKHRACRGTQFDRARRGTQLDRARQGAQFDCARRCTVVHCGQAGTPGSCTMSVRRSHIVEVFAARIAEVFAAIIVEVFAARIVEVFAAIIEEVFVATDSAR